MADKMLCSEIRNIVKKIISPWNTMESGRKKIEFNLEWESRFIKIVKISIKCV